MAGRGCKKIISDEDMAQAEGYAYEGCQNNTIEGLLRWARGFISEDDFDLLRICDHPDEVIEDIQKWYKTQEVVGRKALLK